MECQGFPDGSVVKNLSSNARDMGSIPGSGRSPGEGNDNAFQYSCLGNPTDSQGSQELNMTQQLQNNNNNMSVYLCSILYIRSFSSCKTEILWEATVGDMFYVLASNRRDLLVSWKNLISFNIKSNSLLPTVRFAKRKW